MLNHRVGRNSRSAMTEPREKQIGFELPVVQTPPNILTGISDDFQSAIFPLVYLDPKFHEYHGTAFCIGVLANGQMIFVTAKHVLEPLLNKSTINAYLLVPHLVQDVPGRTAVLALPIDAISASESHNDAAMVRCDLRMTNGIDLIEIRRMPIKMTPAVVGEHTLALGYSRHQIKDQDFTRDFRASDGTVEEVHNKSSDSYFGDYPSFQTNAIYDAGMSGGPVQGPNGGWIGIVTRGSQVLEEVEPWAYATPTACLGELKIELEADDKTKRDWPFPDLVSAGIVEVQRGVAFTLIHESTGLRLEWEEPGV